MNTAGQTINAINEKTAYARLAAATYEDERRSALRKYNMRDYRYVKAFSTDKTAVFRKDNKYIVAFRGTQLRKDGKTASEDIVTDAFLIKNQLRITPRFIESKRLVRELIQKFGNENVILTGHSLGGALAGEIAGDFGLEAYTFNRAASPAQLHANPLRRIAERLLGRRSTNKVKNYYTRGDVFSVIGSIIPGEHADVSVPEYAGDAHTIKNFTGLAETDATVE